jgi:hypothetical protein
LICFFDHSIAKLLMNSSCKCEFGVSDWEKHFQHPEDRMVIPASSFWLAVLGKCETARRKYTEKVRRISALL